MLGFIIWAFVGIAVIAIGIFAFFSKKAVGVWSNMEMFEVTDYKKYNYAVGKMLCIFGVVFIILGFPLLSSQTAPFILFSTVGIIIETIIAMAFYTRIIEKKYRKRK